MKAAYHAINSLLLLSLLSAGAQAADDTGTTIVGNQEAPTVTNVLPWKSEELTVDPWGSRRAPNSEVLNEALQPLDRDELRREIQYFNLVNPSDKDKK
ncbi:MAG TPA: hypothetical protein VFM46_19990 [Pseudomonadales bacterium]|nr:hypothetical protein [Pseudomonadales bacterium]